MKRKNVWPLCPYPASLPDPWLPLPWARRLPIQFPNFDLGCSLNNQLVSKTAAVTPPSLPPGPPSFGAVLTAALPACAKESRSPSLGHTCQGLPAMLCSWRPRSCPSGQAWLVRGGAGRWAESGGNFLEGPECCRVSPLPQVHASVSPSTSHRVTRSLTEMMKKMKH